MVEPLHPLDEHRHRLPDGRHLACSRVGDAHAEDVLLCLPGLLEIRRSFDAVLQAAQAHTGLHAVALDPAGRGDSSPLADDTGYSMARYLEDIRHLIATEWMHGPPRRLHVLGTSMGGILGMYLASDTTLPVRTLILNDVGLSFYWVSMYGLYDGMKRGMAPTTPEALAAQLGVTPGVLRAVQSPAHFDLPYRKDWKGMRFAQVLQHYSGAVRLVHGSASGVCLDAQVQELRQHFAYARVLTVEGAGHPVPFTPEVCDFVLADLGTAPVRSSAREPVPDVLAPPLDSATSPPSPSHTAAVDAPEKSHRGWWHRLRDKFR